MTFTEAAEYMNLYNAVAVRLFGTNVTTEANHDLIARITGALIANGLTLDSDLAEVSDALLYDGAFSVARSDRLALDLCCA
jgi:hypothetical protein